MEYQDKLKIPLLKVEKLLKMGCTALCRSDLDLELSIPDNLNLLGKLKKDWIIVGFEADNL